ncbi:hypothetical protein PQX77_001548 [Marasmius sp. AFHP31]|nr:hypothetical protein PQX77_001548 [Marasmius sp. AFHP31]
MSQLPMFPLPLQKDRPPSGYEWDKRSVLASQTSTSTAFNTSINQRDIFLGVPRCIVCGAAARKALQRCHIIMKSEPETWETIKKNGYIPSGVKSVEHEPRNGLLMCFYHHNICMYDDYYYFIRYIPESVHHSRDAGARFEPTQPRPDIPDQVDYQDWIVTDGLQDGKGGFQKDAPKEKPSQHQVPAGGRRTLALNNDVITEILAATWASPSWKACEMEGHQHQLDRHG